MSPIRERKAHYQMKNAFACMEVDELGAQLGLPLIEERQEPIFLCCKTQNS